MIVKVKCSFPAGDLRIATANLQDQYGNWENKVISLSSLSRSIGDDKSYEVSGISIELNDTDRFFRNMMSGPFRYIVGKSVELYDEHHAWLYTGTVDKWKFQQDAFVIEINDKLSGLDSQVPRIITSDLFPGLTPDAEGQSVPVIYGDIQGSAGAVKCWKVADKKYLIAGHHCHSITALFKEDGSTLTLTDFQLNNDGDPAQDTDFAYADYIGSDTSFDDAFVMADIKGKKGGSETMGTGTDLPDGEFIQNPIDALTDLIASYSNMAYDQSDMDDVKNVMADREYEIAVVIHERQTLEQVLMDFCTSFDCDYFIRKGNRVVVSLLDWTFLKPSGYFNRDQVVDFGIDEFSEDIRNKVYYKYQYHPNEGKFQQTRIYSKQDSIDNWGEFLASNETLELVCVSDDVTATDVVQRYLIQRKNPRRIAQLELPLQEFSGIDISDVIEVQHPNAIDESKRKYQVRRVNIDFTGDSVQVEAVDITYMSGGIFILGDRGNLPQFWNSAAGTQRDYGYMADNVSGFFGNNIDYGKGLY